MPLLQLHHSHDSFLALTTDGINFIMNSQEICNVINQCHDPKEAAQRISDQVRPKPNKETLENKPTGGLRCSLLPSQALHYGSEDNSTIIVVPFGAWGKHENFDSSFSFSRGFVSSGRWA